MHGMQKLRTRRISWHCLARRVGQDKDLQARLRSVPSLPRFMCGQVSTTLSGDEGELRCYVCSRKASLALPIVLPRISGWRTSTDDTKSAGAHPTWLAQDALRAPSSRAIATIDRPLPTTFRRAHVLRHGHVRTTTPANLARVCCGVTTNAQATL